MKKILYIPLAILCFIASNSIAQVTTNFNNENTISSKGQFEKNYVSTIDFIITSKNIDSLLLKEKQEVAQSNELKPFRLASPIKVNLDIAKTIKWAYDTEFAFGKFTLKLSGALSTSISFDKFYLPKNTELFIYNENGNMITGPVTEKENNRDGIWGSWVYQGELLTIEIKTPIATIKEVILHSDNVAYGYKEIYKSIKVGGFGKSGPCNINVICPLGNGWEEERNSVSTLLSANGSEFCTGSLVMNTCGTNIPYYLTANHCFEQGNPNVAGWRFAFQAWSTTCPNPGVNTNGVMYNGATLRARNAPTDFCLVELNQTPPANSGLHYSGWNRSATPAQNATGIHHPKGDLMKISRADNPVSVASAFGTTNQHWQSTWSPQINGAGQTVTAITEGGSSGSPLFDQNHRIIGQLHGGPSFCGTSQPWDFYGRFDLSWTGGGTNATRLSNWLDPGGTNAITTNTTDVSELLPLKLSVFRYCDEGIIKANFPSGSTFIWQVWGDLLIDGVSTTKTTTNNSIYITGTEGPVYVTTTASCGTFQTGVQYESQYRQITGLYPEYTSGDHVSVSVNTYPYDTYYRWYINNTLVKEGSDAYTYCTCDDYESPDARVCKDNTIRVEIETSCNINSFVDGDFYKICGYYKMQPNVEMFPNPARNQITLRLKQVNAKQEQATLKEIRQIKIMDKIGIVKKIITYPSNTNTIIVDISNLPLDIYYVEVTDGRNSERLPLSIVK